MSMARLPTDSIGDGTPVSRAASPVAIEMPAAAARTPDRAPAHHAAKRSLVLCMWVIRHRDASWMGLIGQPTKVTTSSRDAREVRYVAVAWSGSA